MKKETDNSVKDQNATCDNNMLPVRFFSTIEGYLYPHTYIGKFKHKMNFEQVKENIAHAFSLGASKIKLYENYSKKNDFLEINKEDFSKEEIEAGFQKIQLKNKIKLLEDRKSNNNKSIIFFQKANDKIDKEILSLSTFAN
jgi:hypothetical protein